MSAAADDDDGDYLFLSKALVLIIQIIQKNNFVYILKTATRMIVFILD
jgi:hypothetical protein